MKFIFKNPMILPCKVSQLCILIDFMSIFIRRIKNLLEKKKKKLTHSLIYNDSNSSFTDEIAPLYELFLITNCILVVLYVICA